MHRGFMRAYRFDDSNINSVGEVEGYCCRTDGQADVRTGGRTNGEL